MRLLPELFLDPLLVAEGLLVPDIDLVIYTLFPFAVEVGLIFDEILFDGLGFEFLFSRGILHIDRLLSVAYLELYLRTDFMLVVGMVHECLDVGVVGSIVFLIFHYPLFKQLVLLLEFLLELLLSLLLLY